MSGQGRGTAGATQDDPDAIVERLACPVTGSRLRREGDVLVSEEGGLRYPIVDGIPILVRERALRPPGVASLEGFTRRFRS
jgi:uncharacterized protein YbaR (Trm112 family)